MALSGDDALALAKSYTRKTVEGMGATKGDDGFSPIITENPDNTDGEYRLDITDKNGTFTTPNLSGTPKLEEIKKDLADVENEVDQLTITQNFQGSAIAAENTLQMPLKGLHLYGRSTQDGTPSFETPVPIVSAGEKGNVEVGVYGANFFDLENVVFQRIGWQGRFEKIANGVILKAINGWCALGFNVGNLYGKEVTFSCDYQQIDSETNLEDISNVFAIGTADTVKYLINDELKYENNSLSAGNVKISFVPQNFIVFFVRVANEGPNSGSIRTIKITNIQLSLGNNDWNYEFFKKQSLLCSTPNGLPGIPVNSDSTDYTYIDSQGQKWISDEVDFERGVYVKRVGKVTNVEDFRKINILSSTTGSRFKVIPSQEVRYGRLRVVLCNKVKYGCYDSFSEEGDYVVANENDNVIFVRTLESLTLNQFKQLYSNIYILYQLKNNEELPLSDTELQQYKSLMANSPVTTVLNDENVWMETELGIDSKQYMDKLVQDTEQRVREEIQSVETDLSSKVDGVKNSIPSLANNYLVTEPGVSALDAAIGAEIDRRLNEINSNLNGFSFGLTVDGEPGYRKPGADSVLPFNSGANGTLSVSFSFSALQNTGNMGGGSGSLVVIFEKGDIKSSSIQGAGIATTIGGASNANTCTINSFTITSIKWMPA